MRSSIATTGSQRGIRLASHTVRRREGEGKGTANPLKDAIDQRRDMSEDGVVHDSCRQAGAMARRRSGLVGQATRGGMPWPRETSGGQAENVEKT
jgi:hypothetical protein